MKISAVIDRSFIRGVRDSVEHCFSRKNSSRSSILTDRGARDNRFSVRNQFHTHGGDRIFMNEIPAFNRGPSWGVDSKSRVALASNPEDGVKHGFAFFEYHRSGQRATRENAT